MRVIQARNVHQALPKGIDLLNRHGTRRASRNGTVLIAPGPVATVYARPQERIVFWDARDYNPAFVLYEALWMLAGRRDLDPLTRYVKDFGRYSDDGITLHGAYGFRWRRAFSLPGFAPGVACTCGGHEDGLHSKSCAMRLRGNVDQLAIIASRLRNDPDDRRCVLQMWSAPDDLGVASRDVPCNDVATFQRDVAGALDMTVFCRSNDIIWGACYANAFHFSLLQEYMARWIGCPVGRYTQISVNYHAYLETIDQLRTLPERVFLGFETMRPEPIDDPYAMGTVRALPLAESLAGEDGPALIARVDGMIAQLLFAADHDFAIGDVPCDGGGFFETATAVLRAHHLWRTLPAPTRFDRAQAALASGDPQSDLVVSMAAWLARRRARWLDHQAKEVVTTHG